MDSALKEYYTNIYPKCNVSYSFLASWKGVAYPSHLIQIIALPIQILTFHIIWKKTPMNMKSMKWPLLINHFWCTYLDFTLCTLSTPYVFFRCLAFLPVGILSWLGVPNIFQLIPALLSVFCMTGSYIYVFENRSSSLHVNRFRITRLRTKIIYHLLIFLFNCSFLLLLLQSPTNQNAAKLEALKVEPCPTEEFFLNEIFIVATDQNIHKLILWLFAPMITLHAACQIMFHVFCTVYYIFIAPPSKLISPETRQAQKKFFIAICSQTTIPLVIALLPFSVTVLDQFTYSFTQDMMNLTMIIVTLHGIVESIAILSVHRCYRRVVWTIITRKK